jgi:hypothetical protein
LAGARERVLARRRRYAFARVHRRVVAVAGVFVLELRVRHQRRVAFTCVAAGAATAAGAARVTIAVAVTVAITVTVAAAAAGAASTGDLRIAVRRVAGIASHHAQRHAHTQQPKQRRHQQPFDSVAMRSQTPSSSSQRARWRHQPGFAWPRRSVRSLTERTDIRLQTAS